jgi:aspartyl protease family protein
MHARSPWRVRFALRNRNNPWTKNSDPRPTPRWRVILWIATLVLISVAVWRLSALVPQQLDSDWDQARVIQLVVILALVSGGVIFSRRFRLGETVRNIAIWSGIALVLAIAFAFQDELRSVYFRLRAELIPGYPVTTSANELVLTQSGDGHFYVIGDVNGTAVKFLVDTGASDVVLSPADAKRLGIDVAELDFSRPYQTANGVGYGAPYRIAHMALGEVELTDVPVSVNQAPMSESLLGMSVLRNAASMEIRDRKLFLRWR